MTWMLLAPLWFADLVVLGHKCSVHGCHGVASSLVHWPGRDPSPQCEHHRAWCAYVADAMGFQLVALPLPFREWPPPEEPDPSATRFSLMELER